tara:strand:+ start:189 stop:617 length:429 start_codon:yes stop_codon:yes gene_type:complete
MYRLCTAHAGASVHAHTLQHRRRDIAAPELVSSSELLPFACEDVFGAASSTEGHTSPASEDPSPSLARRRRAMRSLARSKSDPAMPRPEGPEFTAACDIAARSYPSGVVVARTSFGGGATQVAHVAAAILAISMFHTRKVTG